MYQQLDEGHFYAELEQTPGISLVFFTRQGCGSCKAWKQLLKRFTEQHEHVSVFELDAEQNMGLVNEYEIFHMPALFLFNHGEFHCELQAHASDAHLLESIEQALQQPPMEAP